jgi:hypothetical protein
MSDRYPTIEDLDRAHGLQLEKLAEQLGVERYVLFLSVESDGQFRERAKAALKAAKARIVAETQKAINNKKDSYDFSHMLKHLDDKVTVDDLPF